MARHERTRRICVWLDLGRAHASVPWPARRCAAHAARARDDAESPFETIRFDDGTCYFLGGCEREGGELDLEAAPVLREFRLEGGLPVWTFALGPLVIEKRVMLPHMQNTVHIDYRVISGKGNAHLELRSSVSFRPHEGKVLRSDQPDYWLHATRGMYEIQGPPTYPLLRIRMCGTSNAFTIDGHEIDNIVFPRRARPRLRLRG